MELYAELLDKKTHCRNGEAMIDILRKPDDIGIICEESGRIWIRTRAYGVNTLAFRLCQNNAFYRIDADCIGIIKNKIDW